MKTLLFVDHVFHLQTKSFEFLVDILRKSFEIRRIFVDPAGPFDASTLDLSTDIVVLAQVDFLTPYFVLHQKSVIVVQMYDGSAGLPEQHWMLNRQARYLNFSQSLHAKALALGCESLLVKYAPNPQQVPKVESFETLRCFFWNRLPTSPINTKSIGELLKGQLDRCHVHLPRDDLEVSSSKVQQDFDCKVTTSNWFQNKSDFDTVLNSCNVFIAPRVAEGIGHAFLDAMARGMLTIAWDLPTHNEYISNWHNGVLINENTKSVNLKDRTDLARIGKMARISIENDYRQWLLDASKIVEFINTCPPCKSPDMPRCRADIESIINSYRLGISKYTSELKKRSLTVSMISQWDQYVSDEPVNIEVPRPKSLYLLFGVGNAKIFQKSGFSVAEELHTWTESLRAKLAIPNTLMPTQLEVLWMRVRVRSIRKNRVTINVNGQIASSFVVGRQWIEHNFAMPPSKLDDNGTTVIDIACSQLVTPSNGDVRNIGVAFERLEIFDGSRQDRSSPKQSSIAKWATGFKKSLSSAYRRAQ